MRRGSVSHCLMSSLKEDALPLIVVWYRGVRAFSRRNVNTFDPDRDVGGNQRYCFWRIQTGPGGSQRSVTACVRD